MRRTFFENYLKIFEALYFQLLYALGFPLYLKCNRSGNTSDF